MAKRRAREDEEDEEEKEEDEEEKEDEDEEEDKEEEEEFHEEEEEDVEEETQNEAAEEYEQYRARRIKENMERMKNLGLVELSMKLKPENPRAKGSVRAPPHKKRPSSEDPPRRSSRLTTITPVNYSEGRQRNIREKPPKDMEICIPEGEKPEVYTKEHAEVLGDCKNSWTLLEDGYDEEGMRIYDPYYGKSCHQCRQKTICKHTECSKCKLVQGQFCGDCLYMRYGENVIEAKENPNWICPVCRDICNCSRCRRRKGWAPTGAVYNKVLEIGYKSVAHYLILTHLQKENGDESSGDLTAGSVEPQGGSNGTTEKYSQAEAKEQEPGGCDCEDDDASSHENNPE
ncbi:unnamed protein product [Cuscuta epithymum]|uniref:Zinc-finger domain-containing protein n=1 Tax=Cuscuta epithymum TaxID=186058 RepID=A0AAV0CAS1_9ASTE|nr:unnamed protein product [Cuscuta epithymum]